MRKEKERIDIILFLNFPVNCKRITIITKDHAIKRESNLTSINVEHINAEKKAKKGFLYFSNKITMNNPENINNCVRISAQG